MNNKLKIKKKEKTKQFNKKLNKDLTKTQAIFTDLDGTLLTDDRKISEKTQEALALAYSKGLPVIVTTGRNQSFVKKLFKDINMFNLAGVSNGSLILDLFSKKELEVFKFTKEETQDITNSINNKFNAYNEIVHLGYEYLHEVKISLLLNELIKWVDIEHNVIIDDALKILTASSEIKLNVLDKTVKEMFPDYYIIECAINSNNWLEILPYEVNKGSAARYIANYSGFDLNKCISVGDELNDIELFKSTGISITVNNADDFVKRFSDYSIASNNEDAVADLIFKVLK